MNFSINYISFVLLLPLSLLASPTAELTNAAISQELDAQGAERPEIQPRICLGYNPETGQWGNGDHMHKDVGKEVRCPTGFAYYGATPPGGLRRPAAAVPVFGSCCPLPSSDILLKEQVEVFEQCPEQYIATGFRLGEDCTRIPLLQYGLCGEGKGHKLLCTKVNTARYQLGEIRNGFFWGVSSKRWHESKFISKQTISAGLRFGLGRVSKYFWRESGCVGDPPGSLLVGKVSKRCRGLLFRELQYRGQSGDPKQGEAVTMFPACDEISDRFEENVFCTK